MIELAHELHGEPQSELEAALGYGSSPPNCVCAEAGTRLTERAMIERRHA